MYNKFHGFSQKPFESLQIPVFSPHSQPSRNMDSMMDGIRNRRGFVSIAGEVGTGKTTLIRFLLGKLEVKDKVKTVLIFYPTLTFKELLKNILLELESGNLKFGEGRPFASAQ